MRKLDEGVFEDGLAIRTSPNISSWLQFISCFLSSLQEEHVYPIFVIILLLGYST